MISSNIHSLMHVQVPLGLLFKNENKTDDMIDILTELHDQYLPAVQHRNAPGTTILDRCFFGGDQLTDERARNSILARSDGDHMYEQLKGFIPKVENWHCGRLIYQVNACGIFENDYILYIFFKCLW